MSIISESLKIKIGAHSPYYIHDCSETNIGSLSSLKYYLETKAGTHLLTLLLTTNRNWYLLPWYVQYLRIIKKSESVLSTLLMHSRFSIVQLHSSDIVKIVQKKVSVINPLKYQRKQVPISWYWQIRIVVHSLDMSIISESLKNQNRCSLTLLYSRLFRNRYWWSLLFEIELPWHIPYSIIVQKSLLVVAPLTHTKFQNNSELLLTP